MRDQNVDMLLDTLHVLKHGQYETNGKTVKLKLSAEEMKKAQVLLPDDVYFICRDANFEGTYKLGRCSFDCTNEDTFVAAQREDKIMASFQKNSGKPVLVLNFANPVNPGGGVRVGARAQEEDLCRKSSLLLSLEGKQALKYYGYNRKRNVYNSSDAMIFSPQVEVIRDKNGDLLDETMIAAVLTCAAPIVRTGEHCMEPEKYRNMVRQRIEGMLKCAAYFGYRYLVLGAWGCGVFGNDARMMSDLFFEVLKQMDYHGFDEKDLFDRIHFAVLDRSEEQKKFKEFYRNFGAEHYYQEAEEA